ncbi:MAG: hypothetical protein AAF416_22830 [Pseudomonadota bacterium]
MRRQRPLFPAAALSLLLAVPAASAQIASPDAPDFGDSAVTDPGNPLEEQIEGGDRQPLDGPDVSPGGAANVNGAAFSAEGARQERASDAELSPEIRKEIEEARELIDKSVADDVIPPARD